MHSLPYNSQSRGLIERLNKTLWNPLSKTYPTYLGADKDKEASQKVHKCTRKDIAEFGTSRLLPSWEQFKADCALTIEEYNNRPHSSLPKFRDPATGKMRHASPNDLWELHAQQGFELVTVDEHEIDDLFRPYEIRTVRRAEIQWNTNTYFHTDLERFHLEKVAVGYDLDDADRVWIRELDETEDGIEPGRLICVARFGGNKRDYIPRTFQRAAEEKRAQGRLKRLEKHVDEARSELRPAALLEHRPGRVVELPVVKAITEEKEPATVSAISEAQTNHALPQPRKLRFSEDWELAAHAIQNGADALSPNQISILRDCLNRQLDRELLRMNGVDLAALEDLVRSAA